ncbi:MAG: DciA family protein [Rickettsiales bacterium]|nr:DciA family protein [Rickettsiales bacterium]
MIERSGIVTIENAITSLLKPIFIGDKKKFIAINYLQKNWENIIGNNYYKFCLPKIIKFDRLGNKATLTIIAYNSSIAFLIENNQNNIIEKIRTLSGLHSIDKIKILQQPANINSKIIRKNNFYQKSSEEITNIRNKIEDILNKIEDKEIKNTLEDLAISIFSK